MKKFSKLVAVVLAIAVIICPMMSVVSHATTTGGYKIEAVDANNLKLTINSTDGFIAYHATVGFNSNTAFQSSYNADNYTNGLKVISYTLKTAEANDHNKPAISANASGNSLTVIVMPSDINNLDKCTEIVIGIRVADGTTASLTKIQAADDGADVTADPTLLTFPAAGSDGVIDSTAQDYIASNATTSAHTHSFTQQTQTAAYLKTAATCTADATYWYSCATCGLASSTEYFTATGTKIAHTPDHTKTFAKDAATCTTDATYYDECSVCHQQLDTFWTENNTALGHNMTHHDSVSSTCLVQGNIEYYSCSRCGKFFAEESGATELTAEQTKRALAAHTPATAVTENTVAATCSATGSYDSVVYCSVCGAEISRTPNVIAKLAHTVVEDAAVAATCTATGLTAGSHCSVCNTVLVAQETVPALGHAYTYHANGDGTHTVGCERCDYSAQETCDTEGTDGVCSKCGYKAATEPETQHSYATPVRENITATSYESVIYCSGCGAEIARYTISIPSGVDESTSILPDVHGASLGDTIGINFKFRISSLPAGASKYSLDVVRYTSNGFNFTESTATISTYNTSTAGGFIQFSTYYGLELFSLTVPITYTIHCYDSGNNEIAYQTFTTTAEEICKNYHDLSSTSAKAKRAVADIINVGAAAQRYFNDVYPTRDYATKLYIASTDSEYASTGLDLLAAYDTSSGLTMTPSISVLQSPYFNIRFSGNVANKADYSIEVSYYNKIKKQTITTVLDGDTFTGNATTINAKFEGLPLFAGDSEVTFTLYQNNAVVGVRTYCLDQHISNQAALNTDALSARQLLMRDLYIKIGQMGQAMRDLRNIQYVG